MREQTAKEAAQRFEDSRQINSKVASSIMDSNLEAKLTTLVIRKQDNVDKVMKILNNPHNSCEGRFKALHEELDDIGLNEETLDVFDETSIKTLEAFLKPAAFKSLERAIGALVATERSINAAMNSKV